MAEAFKNALNVGLIEGIAQHFSKHWPDFDQRGFIAAASHDLDSLELKARSQQITAAMQQYLPTDFSHAANILQASLGPVLGDELSAGQLDQHGIAGWALMPIADYVAEQGQADFALSMVLLEAITQRFTAEFAIRPFLLAMPDKTLAQMRQWASSANQHVRRLASEGCRPRLPWSMNLPMYIQDPSPLLPLLEQLKDDPSEYVRRSVANNLNDIAKDHPDVVAGLAEKWLVAASKQRQRLVKHACRSLIKQGHDKTLKVLGYGPPQLAPAKLTLQTSTVPFGQALVFELTLASTASKPQPLMIDYIIHHQKANGQTSPKVFKLKVAKLAASKSLTIHKKHPIRKITTRVYYPGQHAIEIVINGQPVAREVFELLM